MPPSIDAEQLDAFVTFAEHMSFTRAARERRVSQPALHTQIKKLGESLGVTLYVRRGGKLALTADGERVLGFGRDARERLQTLVAELAHRDVGGPIVLAAGEGSYLYLLGDALRRFTASRRAELRLLVRDHEGTIEAVRTGEAHLGVAPLDAVPQGISAEGLTEVGQALVVPASHPMADRTEVRLSDLAGEALIAPPLGRPHRTMLMQALRGAGVAPRVAVEAGGWELMIRFVEMGMGVAVVNAFCRVPEGLVKVPLPELPAKAYWLLRKRRAAREGAVSALAAMVRETANGWKKRS